MHCEECCGGDGGGWGGGAESAASSPFSILSHAGRTQEYSHKSEVLLK